MKTKYGLYASRDKYIEELINDPDYEVRENGEIWTLIQLTGKRSVCGNWRKLIARLNYRGKKQSPCLEIRYKYHHLFLHRIMYRKFNGKLDPMKVINHIDGDPTNNHPSNLELVTQQANSIHAYQVLGRKPSRGRAVLSDETVRGIREDRSKGISYAKLMEKYGIKHKSTISGICSGKLYPERLLKQSR